MKITKQVWGHTVELELVKIKDYPRHSLYQVFEVKNGKRIPVYKECYTPAQLRELVKSGYTIAEEVLV